MADIWTQRFSNKKNNAEAFCNIKMYAIWRQRSRDFPLLEIQIPKNWSPNFIAQIYILNLYLKLPVNFDLKKI